MGALFALGCGLVADPANHDGGARGWRDTGGAPGWRDAGAVLATGGRPLTPEEAACDGVFHPLVAPDADAGACEFLVPSNFDAPDSFLRVRLTDIDVIEGDAFTVRLMQTFQRGIDVAERRAGIAAEDQHDRLPAAQLVEGHGLFPVR